MSEELFAAVDQYIDTLFAISDPILEDTIQAIITADLPQISVSPNQGKLLYLLALLSRSRNILEIGTLGGYSTIWLGRALPEDGHLITLEANPRHAKVAQANIERAGLAAKVEIRVGPALETLPQLSAAGTPPFDMVFIDADKSSYQGYLKWALQLTRPGSLIVADNVVRDGAVVDPNSTDETVQAVQRFNAALADEPRVTATIIQTIGVKGYDGMAIAIVK